MSEKTAENEVTTVSDLLEGEDKSRGEGEGDEKVQAGEEENAAAFLALKPDQMNEDTEKTAECQVPAVSKNKPGRVHLVFSRVRDQIRGQPGCEVRRTGMLQLVQHVTRQLDRNRVEQEGFEDTSPRKEVQETLEAQEEIIVDLENEQTKEESKIDKCVVLLQQILNSIDGLRKEVGEELKLLRQESQSNTDKMLRELQTQLTHALQTNANTSTPVSVPSLPGAPRRRILRRTLTTMTPKNSTAQSFRPRCMSEPVGGRNVETASAGSGTLPTSSLELLLPSIVVTQQAKKPVRSKANMKKLAT